MTDSVVRFDAFMREALYGERGFYIGTGRAGRRGGDFLTSPEVGPLFGAVLARALDAWWDELGRPHPFTVVDAGAGPGTLARTILAAQPRCLESLRLVAVEISAAQRARHPEEIESRASMPDEELVGVVIANELLDNLPFRLLVFEGEWREAFVANDGNRLLEVTRPLEERPEWLPSVAPHGARIPWQQEAAGWVESALQRLARGHVVAFDYFTATTAELATSPWREWLRTFRGHERGGHYLATPGQQDITAQVALDQLPAPASVETQANFLRRFGIDELVEEGRHEWSTNAARPSVAALAMRSRVREAEALLDPLGLGTFTATTWRA